MVPELGVDRRIHVELLRNELHQLIPEIRELHVGDDGVHRELTLKRALKNKRRLLERRLT